jgi:hypothetical protein
MFAMLFDVLLLSPFDMPVAPKSTLSVRSIAIFTR